MRRILVALALASLPAVIAAQNATAPNNVANDRLNLDLYWEYETVSDPQLSPDGAQIIYTRGWIDKINDKRESSLWVMNADGSKNRFLVRGSNARWSPTGDRIVYTAQGDPKGSQIFVRYMDAEGADLADHAPHRIAGERHVVARRPVDRVRDEGREEERLVDQDAASGPKAPSGSRRRASSSGSTIARTARASTTMASGTCSWCRPPAARRGS